MPQPLFAFEVGKSQLKALSRHVALFTVEPGSKKSIIDNEGFENSRLFIVLEGQVRVEEPEKEPIVLSEGSVFGT